MISLVLTDYLMLYKHGEMLLLKAEFNSQLGGWEHVRDLSITTLLPSHYSADLGSKLLHQCKMAALVSLMIWFIFYNGVAPHRPSLFMLMVHAYSYLLLFKYINVLN